MRFFKRDKIIKINGFSFFCYPAWSGVVIRLPKDK